MFDYGDDKSAIEYIRDYWGSMLQRGATTFWEHFSRAWPDWVQHPSLGTSVCHGWSAGPTFALGAHVLGVRPLEPGFTKVLVEPKPGGLAWAEGRVPTPRGPIEVSWRAEDESFRLRVDAPDGTGLRISLPSAGTRDEVFVANAQVRTVRRHGRAEYDTSGGVLEVVHRRRHTSR
jgi:hypothetical protein